MARRLPHAGSGAVPEQTQSLECGRWEPGVNPTMRPPVRIWFDTEFVDTGSVVHLLSIGMVREDGATYYAEPVETDRSLACAWVRKNVLPHMPGPVKPRTVIRDEIVTFAGSRPEFWGYFVAYDWLVLCQLFGRMLDVPSDWPNFAFDVQALRCLTGVRSLPNQSSVEHNALNDALWTREACLSIWNETRA